MSSLLIKRVHPLAILPAYQSNQAAGLDLHACLECDVILQPNERRLIGTGIAIELLSHLEAQIRTRSGLALKRGLVVGNGVGTIDADYRGEIGVILHNISDEPQPIKHGDRIAQMIIAEFVRADLELVEQLADTDRGNSGFGSTGV